jgi:hypothetical protein
VTTSGHDRKGHAVVVLALFDEASEHVHGSILAAVIAVRLITVADYAGGFHRGQTPG